jgi:hypothetical protein
MGMNSKNLHVSLEIKALSRAQESHPKYSNTARCSLVAKKKSSESQSHASRKTAHSLYQFGSVVGSISFMNYTLG